MGETMPNETKTYECSYCHGVGACPQCWGRAAIEELKAQVKRWEDVEELARVVCAREGTVRTNPYGRAEDFHSLWAAVANLRAALKEGK